MKTVRFEMGQGVATIVLANPPLNILTRAVLGELREALSKLESEPALRAVRLIAEGPHFSAGADVGEHLPPDYRVLIPEMAATLERLLAFPVPVVAAVRGRCLGGGFELAQAVDVIVAGESATFGQPEILLGVTAPFACVLLPRRVAPGAAAELLYGGDTIPAVRARELGIVQRVVSDAHADDEALAVARRWASHSAPALRAIKRTLHETAPLSRERGLEVASSIYVNDLMRSEDPAEGLEAFLAKRAPVWRHR